MDCSKNGKTYLQRAIKKYGSEYFKCEILETVNFHNDLDQKERDWIKLLNPSYNITEGGEGGDTSKSPNFIDAMLNRKTTKGMSYEERYGEELAVKLKENRSKSNKERDYYIGFS